MFDLPLAAIANHWRQNFLSFHVCVKTFLFTVCQLAWVNVVGNDLERTIAIAVVAMVTLPGDVVTNCSTTSLRLGLSIFIRVAELEHFLWTEPRDPPTAGPEPALMAPPLARRRRR